MPQHLERLREAYSVCKQTCQADWSGSEAGTALKKFVQIALRFLQVKCVPKELVSQVPGKEYIGFRRKDSPKGISRPVNKALFRCDASAVNASWDGWVNGTLPPVELAAISYTACLAPCVALELFDRQNKKGPATFFECIIGHVFSKALRCNPQKGVMLAIEGDQARMTMDFLFHPRDRQWIHLPVKMSTRERVVQAWAHQKILDAAFGNQKYRGIMVLFAETKLDSRSLEVVEICVPDQWLVYQSLLSRMERIYYFDVPERYRELARQHPEVRHVKEFCQFFAEKDRVLAGPRRR